MSWKHFSIEQAAERFDASEDLTIGIEEEFQIIDPESLELANRFEELFAKAHPVMGTNVCGELIASEIEINSRKCHSLTEAEEDMREKRRILWDLAAQAGLALGAAGTHPFSDWKEQRILDTAHYREVEERARYCAWKNLTYGMHVHVGIRGRERMIAVFNAMRGYIPYLLALSANSPFAEGRLTYLHSTRSQIFTRSFPRCNIPGRFKDWHDYASFVELLFNTGSISDPMQMWWSIRPHPWLGTIEIRICDCQTTLPETMALASLTVALIAQLGQDYDEGKLLPLLVANQLEENLWRATRYGLSGSLINFDAGAEESAPDGIRRIADYTGDQWTRLGATGYLKTINKMLREGNGAQRQIQLYDESRNIKAVFANVLDLSRLNYSAA